MRQLAVLLGELPKLAPGSPARQLRSDVAEFNQAELTRGFDDLVTWARFGKRPGGDAILDRRAVADQTFGCTYASADRPSFGAARPR
ncbi:hypothetical protein GCM10010399_52410 [Dactylosporangium fulvum]|uniref:Uncharacterized protein n=1 Tax=Dactylosporangium fulvum TaxID=53359 RepID=A0ABY5W9X8_9ACTN|nr:hypothetical protein [Dactylosporangium fulvum]UWP86367.1 hypothetical protein Dfulv_19850 [Dactylosporangium fulvum]